MTTRQVGEPPPGATSRPAKDAASVLLLLGTGTTLLMALLAAGSVDVEGLQRAHRWAVEEGPSAAAQIGWCIGVIVTTLLAFYAVILGQALLDDSRSAELRTKLSTFGLYFAAALTPLVGLVVYGAVAGGRGVGGALVTVLGAGVVYVLAVQLGTFNIADTATRLARAREAKALTLIRLHRLRRRSRRPVWAVAVINGVASVVLSAAAIAVGSSWNWRFTSSEVGDLLAATLFAVTFVVVVMANGPGLVNPHADRLLAWVSRVLGGTVLVLFLAIVLLSRLMGRIDDWTAVSWGLAICLPVVSALFPAPAAPCAWWDWTLRGALVTASARSEARRVRRLQAVVRSLDVPAALPDRAPPRGQRMAQLLRGAVDLVRRDP